MQASRLAARLAGIFHRTPAVLSAVPSAAIGGLVALAAFAPAAQAIVVASPVSNVVIPATTAGLYFNVVTGATGSSPAAVPGWDVNPWGSGSLFVYGGTGGGVVSTTSGAVANLGSGTLVDSSSSFRQGPGAASFGNGADQWTLNATNAFGFSFIGDDAALHYGYGTMNVGATPLIRSLGNVYYESAANTGITVGAMPVTAVPEPSNVALMLAGGAVIGGIAMRRRRASGR